MKEERTDDWPWGESTRAEFELALDLDRLVDRWGKGFAAEYVFPNRRGDEAFRRPHLSTPVRRGRPRGRLAPPSPGVPGLGPSSWRLGVFTARRLGRGWLLLCPGRLVCLWR